LEVTFRGFKKMPETTQFSLFYLFTLFKVIFTAEWIYISEKSAAIGMLSAQ
jgi:hypothetical protein